MINRYTGRQSTSFITNHFPVVVRLGGFHTEMSFLGSIGYLMSNSGLDEVMESVYAPAAVVHMLSGKAVVRAVRGHFLVYTALTLLLVSEAYEISVNILEKNHWSAHITPLSGRRMMSFKIITLRLVPVFRGI